MRDIFDDETRQKILNWIESSLVSPKFGKNTKWLPTEFRAQVEAEARNAKNCDDDARLFQLAYAVLLLVDRKKWVRSISMITTLPNELRQKLIGHGTLPEDFDVEAGFEMFLSADPERMKPLADWINKMPAEARRSLFSELEKSIRTRQ